MADLSRGQNRRQTMPKKTTKKKKAGTDYIISKSRTKAAVGINVMYSDPDLQDLEGDN